MFDGVRMWSVWPPVCFMSTQHQFINVRVSVPTVDNNRDDTCTADPLRIRESDEHLICSAYTTYAYTPLPWSADTKFA